MSIKASIELDLCLTCLHDEDRVGKLIVQQIRQYRGRLYVGRSLYLWIDVRVAPDGHCQSCPLEPLPPNVGETGLPVSRTPTCSDQQSG